MSALVFSGYWLFVYDATGRKRTATLSGLLFFIGGGLGFFYFLTVRRKTRGTSPDLHRLL